MIRVTVELLPSWGGPPKHLGTAEIVNAGTGTKEIGDYRVRLSKWGKPTHTWKKGKYRGFPRLKYGPWDLLALCLIATLGKRLRRALGEGGGDG